MPFIAIYENLCKIACYVEKCMSWYIKNMLGVLWLKWVSFGSMFSYMVLHDGSLVLRFELEMFNDYLWKHAILIICA